MNMGFCRLRVQESDNHLHHKTQRVDLFLQQTQVFAMWESVSVYESFHRFCFVCESALLLQGSFSIRDVWECW